MSGPRAVVIPFGIPEDGRGLGLGLAALVHSFTQIEGSSVALAHLLARSTGAVANVQPGGEGVATSVGVRPLEAFVPPQAWKDLAGSGHAPPDVTVVLTGSLEPPAGGKGLIQLLAFDARDGSTRAKVEHHLDGARAGETLIEAFDVIWTRVGGELGLVRDIGDLSWDALESVLRAERCVLHDPARNGPHDRLAAMLHLGRAVSEAPESKFPAGRLAAIALETAMAPSRDTRLADAALRALTRASEDAPAQIELLEATAALHVRIGNAREAESRAASAITQAPSRGRLYAVLSEARRALGNLDGALDAIDAGLVHANQDALLATERGVVLAARGDLLGAESAWRAVLEKEPLHPSAFSNLASLAMNRRDAALAQSLVDQVLASPVAHPEVIRRAVHLALATEADGVARAARIASLTTALLERVPVDAWASLMLARAALQMGDSQKALEQLFRVEALAADSVFAAEAQRGRFALTDPQAAMELDSILRAAATAGPRDLEVLGARARRLATLHAVWSAWFAVGVVERRRERWAAAREALERAVTLAKGATPAHLELAGTCAAMGDAAAALSHSERVCELEGHDARTLGGLASALFAAGRADEAEATVRHALELDPNDDRNQKLAARMRTRGQRSEGLFARFRRRLFGPGRD
jgi:tetratricopeptide (TPR) repeat protein